MEFVFIDEVKSGMILGRDLYMSDSIAAPYLRAGTVMNSDTIANLRNRGVSAIYINSAPQKTEPEDAIPEEIYIPPRNKPVISAELREKAVNSLRDIYHEMESTVNDISLSSEKVTKQLDTVVGEIVSALAQDHGALVNINDLKSYDDYTFHHSLSVTVLSVSIGQQLGLSNDQLVLLGKTAMMHDIGKIAVPIDIVQKPSRLDEDEFAAIRCHPSSGCDVLFRRSVGDRDMRVGILHHHEKMDGTGYPYGIKGEAIPVFSRIIAVADVYDALTSNRPYRTPMRPAEAVEYIMGGVDTWFDYDIVMAFIRKLEMYPVGSYVQLSNGEIAVVMDTENPMRPVVKLMPRGEIIDLCRDRNCLQIVIIDGIDTDAD